MPSTTDCGWKNWKNKYNYFKELHKNNFICTIKEIKIAHSRNTFFGKINNLENINYDTDEHWGFSTNDNTVQLQGVNCNICGNYKYECKNEIPEFIICKCNICPIMGNNCKKNIGFNNSVCCNKCNNDICINCYKDWTISHNTCPFCRNLYKYKHKNNTEDDIRLNLISEIRSTLLQLSLLTNEIYTLEIYQIILLERENIINNS
jgi:hypothetical protein